MHTIYVPAYGHGLYEPEWGVAPVSYTHLPVLARRLNFYTAIAPAAATSEDTTLPMLVRYTSEEVVVMAVFNGVICSALVPVLIRFVYHVF